MIKNINKKGVSAVVATVLIILITVAAVTIIWAAIIPLVSNQLEKSDACLNAVKDLSIGTQGYTCYSSDLDGNNANGEEPGLNVQVRRGANEAGLRNVQFSLDFGGTSETYTPSLSEGIPGANGALVYTIDATANGVPELSSKPSAVSVAPIVKLGNSEVTCEIAATMTNIPDCTA